MIIIVIIEVDGACSEIGWHIKDATGKVVKQISPGDHPSCSGHAVHHVELISGARYTFTLWDGGNEVLASTNVETFKVLQDNNILAAGESPFEEDIYVTFTTL